MNKDKIRRIHTGLYSKVAEEIIDSVLGQLSDGWGENNPANDKWWKFANCERATDGEVVIDVSTESGKCTSWNYHNHYVFNGFFRMSDDEVKQKFAGWIKKTAKMEMKDEGAGNMWNRESKMSLDYLNREENVTAADAYFVYEKLLDRDNVGKYSAETVVKVFGKKLTEEETKANEDKLKQLEIVNADRDEQLKKLKEKKDAAIKQIEEQYNNDWRAIVEQHAAIVKNIKA